MVLDSCRRGDEGLTSSEYIGAFAIVIVLAAALAALTGSDVGQAVLDGTSRGICRVISVAGFGGDCNGGSVKAANAAELMGQPDVDGLLVGGASLDADEFAKIVQAARS